MRCCRHTTRLSLSPRSPPTWPGARGLLMTLRTQWFWRDADTQHFSWPPAHRFVAIAALRSAGQGRHRVRRFHRTIGADSRSDRSTVGCGSPADPRSERGHGHQGQGIDAGRDHDGPGRRSATSCTRIQQLSKVPLLPSFESVEQAVQGLVAVFGQFKLTAADMPALFDKLNEGANEYAVSVRTCSRQRSGRVARSRPWAGSRRVPRLDDGDQANLAGEHGQYRHRLADCVRPHGQSNT